MFSGPVQFEKKYMKSCVNAIQIARAFQAVKRLLIYYMIEKTANARVLHFLHQTKNKN